MRIAGTTLTGPDALTMSRVPVAVAAITPLAAVEEFAIASTTRSYDPDHRGVLRETIARVIR